MLFKDNLAIIYFLYIKRTVILFVSYAQEKGNLSIIKTMLFKNQWITLKVEKPSSFKNILD